MVQRMRRRTSSVALFAIATLVAVGCVPITWTGTGTGSGPGCLPGSWTLDTASITEPLSTWLGSLTITPDNDGVTLDMTTSTWSLTADQDLSVSGMTPWGPVSGTANVTGSASGTYGATASRITFTLSSLSGSVTFDGTVNGNHYAGNVPLRGSGIERLYNLSGRPAYTCNSGGLTLTWPGHRFHF